MAHERAPSIPPVAPPTTAVVWVLLYCALVGLTLNNTHPYQGDEGYYIKSAVGMLKAGNLLLPQYDGTIRLQKPLLAYWLTALGYKIFGISLWAGRVPFLLVAAALLILVHRFAVLIHPDREFAYLAVVLVSSSMLFVLFSRVSMSDLPLTLFSTLALYFLCRAMWVPGRLRYDVGLAWLSMAAGFWAKGVMALLPLAAVTAYLVLARPTGARTSLRAMLVPRHLLAFVFVASPWYIYLWLAYPVQLRAQFAQEAADNLAPRVATLLGHLPFYVGALVVYQLPAMTLAVWAWWRNRRVELCPSRLGPLAWYGAFSLAVFVLLLAHHRDRYLLLVVPALALIMSHVIHLSGVTRTARRLAAMAAIAQIVAIWVHSYVVGRPLHDLVRYWEAHLQGDLAAHALADRETTWTLAITGGRLVPFQDRTPYVVTSADHIDHFPGYEVVRRAARVSRLGRDNGWFTVKVQEFVLLGLRDHRASAGRSRAGDGTTEGIRTDTRPAPTRLGLHGQRVASDQPRVHDADPLTSAAALNFDIERLVRDCPEQYLWSDKRFRVRPPGEANPYRPLWQ
jgi:hypothetical protein